MPSDGEDDDQLDIDDSQDEVEDKEEDLEGDIEEVEINTNETLRVVFDKKKGNKKRKLGRPNPYGENEKKAAGKNYNGRTVSLVEKLENLGFVCY
jgi:hypothetical protein